MLKPSQKQPNYIKESEGFDIKIKTKNPTNVPTAYPNKLRAVTPTKTENKPPNIKSKFIIQPEVKLPSSNPPKKPPPDSKYNNHAGGQRVRVGAADIKPGQHRTKVKWKDTAPAQRVPGRENNKQWKDAAPAQRVPGRRNKKQKKYAAQIQRVTGQIQLRVHNNPREGVLDTLQVSMHPNVGPGTGGTRTIMIPVIGD